MVPEEGQYAADGAMQNLPVAFMAELPGLYAVNAQLDGVQAARANLVVRTPVA
jgi:hypothetical protein